MSEKTKLIIWSSVLGFLALAIGGGGYYFIWMNRIQPTRKEIRSLEDKISDMERKVAQIDTLRKTKRDLKASVDEFRKELPSLEENTPEQFMQQLHTIANEVGVNVSQYSPGGGGSNAQKGGGSAGYETITMNIQAEGEVFRLFRYIWTLENQERLMRVNSFSISPEETQLSLADLQELRGAAFVGDTQENGEKSLTKYVGTMNLTTTIYIYKPPE